MSLSLLTRAWEYVGLPPVTKFVLIALADFANEKKGFLCIPSKTTIAVRCGIHKRTVDRHLAALVEADLITIEPRTSKRGDPTTNSYLFNLEKLAAGGNALSPFAGVVADCHRGGGTVPGGGVTGDTGGGGTVPGLSLTGSINGEETAPAPPTPHPSFDSQKITDAAWFLAWWKFAFLKFTGQPYWPNGKDAGIVSGLIKTGGLIELMKRACCYLDQPESKRFPKNEPPALYGLKFQVNALAGAYDDMTERQFSNMGLLPDFDTMPDGFDLTDFRPWEGADNEQLQNATA